MKGIILAGGSGTRLYPMTLGLSKQLLPVYDKPMIYYPLSALMLAGIRDILIITTPHDQAQFQALLGDGSQFGVKLSLRRAAEAGGTGAGLHHRRAISSASDHCALVLGDNIFFGHGLPKMLHAARGQATGATYSPTRSPTRSATASSRSTPAARQRASRRSRRRRSRTGR